MKYKILIILVLVLLTTSTITLAEDLNSLNQAIKDNADVIDSLGDGRDILIGMSKDFFDIARYIIITGIIISVFLMYLDFGNAADNPQLVTKIKDKALWHVLGLLFTLNFWSIYNFVRGVLSKINLL